jgi:quinol monooxygenase YgiN
MMKVGLVVEMKAKLGKEVELAVFLAEAHPMAVAVAVAVAEPGTVTWFAARLGAQTFMIFDTFNNDSGRQAHLKGAIAAALTARADDLLAGPPEIRTTDVLAVKLS